jgi:hypothetical protein
MIARADKGNSLVIIPTIQYDSKIEDFMQGNGLLTSNANPTKSFQAQVRRVINNSKTLIPPNSKWQHIHMNPTTPTIEGLIKLHKPGHPICLVVNWKGDPSYILVRLFTQKIEIMAPLSNTHNLENTRNLIRKLEDTPVLPQFALAYLDITNLYTNIQIKETREIIASTLKKNQTNPPVEQELLNWYDTITEQNYFSNRQNTNPTRWTSHGGSNLRHKMGVFSPKSRRHPPHTPFKQTQNCRILPICR